MNSVASDSDELANCGVISDAFRKTGGDALAAAFMQDGLLNMGELRAYDGDMGQLQCKVVAHLGLRRWESAASTQVLFRVKDLY